MNCVSRTIAAAGQATVSTERICSRVANGSPERFLTACTRMAALWAITTTASQKGKKPLWGPSGPQRKPSRMASTRTTTPRSIRRDAVAMSAARIQLLEQAALGHQLLVQVLVLLQPLGVLGAGGEGGLQRPVLEVLLEFGRLVDLAEEVHVEVDRFLRHVGRAEDAPQHLVVDVDPERPYAPRPHVADALDGVVDGGIDVLAHQVDAHLSAALERDVAELHA